MHRDKYNDYMFYTVFEAHVGAKRHKPTALQRRRVKAEQADKYTDTPQVDCKNGRWKKKKLASVEDNVFDIPCHSK